MKKICIKLLFIICVQLFIFNINGYASIASISTSNSINVGSDFTVTLNVPANSAGAQANILVKYSDGSTNSAVIAFTESYGSKSVSFNAKVAGTATVSATNIIISDADGNPLENGGSISTSIQINSLSSTVPAPTQNSETSVQPNTSKNDTSTTNDSKPKEPNFSQTNDTVYAKKSMNVRSSWSTSSNKIGGLSAGQAVTRIAVGDNGWSKISYNGKIAYVSTSLITTTKPQPVEEKKEEIVKEQPGEIKEEVIEENIENNIEEVLQDNSEKTEEQIYQEIVSQVGTIPEVGNNNNIFIYIILLIFSILASIIILKK